MAEVGFTLVCAMGPRRDGRDTRGTTTTCRSKYNETGSVGAMGKMLTVSSSGAVYRATNGCPGQSCRSVKLLLVESSELYL